MAYTITSDIARMLEVGQKEIFTTNFDAFPVEYPAFTTKKSSTKKTETYDSVGNLKAAVEKIEGGAITYDKLTQAYQTSITNKTWSNGFSYSMEAYKYDQYGVIDEAKGKELARTMRELEETNAIKRFDEAFATNLADGVPLCTASRPCVNAPGTLNSTLATASSLTNPENHKTMIKKFSNFVNHSGGKMKTYPNKGLTNIQNQMDIEEIYQSSNKANEISNTKNSLPKIDWNYSTYLTSLTAWFMYDSKFDFVLFQEFMGTEFGMDEDKISTKNLYFNAIAMYNTGVLPNIGIVGNAGV